jgi:hypothetical protein
MCGEIVDIGDFDVDLRRSEALIHSLTLSHLNREVQSKMKIFR